MVYLTILPILGLLLWPTLYLVFSRPRYLAEVADPKDPSQTSKITILIPARDEENNLALLLPSINGQTSLLADVIVIDDHSTDNTAAIAKKYGAQVITADELPQGWRGKPWALHCGSQHVSSEWLLFLDADLTLKPNALEKITTLIELSPEGGHAHSICPYHDVHTIWENLSAFFNLLMHTGTNAFSRARHKNSADDQRERKSSLPSSAIFGQTLLIHHNDYQKIDGHQSVKNEILENFHLSKTLADNHIETHAHLGRGTFHMRMFTSLSQLWNSWKKATSNGAAHAPGHALLHSSLWITGAMFTIVSLLLTFIIIIPRAESALDFIPAALTLLAYFLYRTQLFFAFRKIGSFGFFTSSLWPIFLLFYQALFFTSLLSKKKGQSTTWKGRQINP